MNGESVIIPLGVWNTLGRRTFWLFVSQKLDAPIGFFVLALIFTVLRFVSSVPAQIAPFIGISSTVCFLIFILSTAFAFLSSWFIYKSHEYCVSEDALKIRKGILTKQETAIPYRQIQNIDIERKLSEQILGLSRIVITLDEQDEHSGGKDVERMLPPMDKDTVTALQDILLKRADVQKVIQTTL